MLTDWEWFAATGKWGLLCHITVDPQGLVPETTAWYVLADDDYPWGSIEFLPAKKDGLQHTHPHQSHNAVGDEKLPWRDGKICAQTSLRSFGRRLYDVEPMTAVERLSWRVSRAHEWLVAAGQDRLTESGEPFELPDFPGCSAAFEIAFREDETSFGLWNACGHTIGTVDFASPASNDAVLAVVAFKDSKARLVRSIVYGDVVPFHKTTRTGIWIKVPRVPCIPPWQAPASFGELRVLLVSLGVDLDKVLGVFAREIRDGASRSILFGFPIPLRVGAPNTLYHWQGLMLPALSHGNPNGFSPTEKGYVARDKARVLTDATRLTWLTSRNWEPQEITARGRLPDALTSRKIVIVGVGALGAMIAELLVREGCTSLVLVDAERLQVGNLSRHILQLNDVCKTKASAVANRLRSVNPYVRISSIEVGFPPSDDTHRTLVRDCNLVIDCTADDTVLERMSTFEWHADRLFVSASVGMYARRLFFFSACGRAFPHLDFIDRIRPWIERETKEYVGCELPREGAGCWHPLFPARSDDLWLMASVAVKQIEELSVEDRCDPELHVFEQIYDGPRFQGIHRI
jgi:hypothetical protein